MGSIYKVIFKINLRCLLPTAIFAILAILPKLELFLFNEFTIWQIINKKTLQRSVGPSRTLVTVEVSKNSARLEAIEKVKKMEDVLWRKGGLETESNHKTSVRVQKWENSVDSWKRGNIETTAGNLDTSNRSAHKSVTLINKTVQTKW